MQDPIRTAKELVAAAITDREGSATYPADVYVVWFCYILGGWKALLSTPVADGRYYEVTYDKAKGRAYIDTYAKERNESVFLADAEE